MFVKQSSHKFGIPGVLGISAKMDILEIISELCTVSGENCNKQNIFYRYSNICVKLLLTGQIVSSSHILSWPFLLAFRWNGLLWSLLQLLFVATTYGKVSLWLCKRLENSGHFFSYFAATMCNFREEFAYENVFWISFFGEMCFSCPWFFFKLYYMWSLTYLLCCPLSAAKSVSVNFFSTLLNDRWKWISRRWRIFLSFTASPQVIPVDPGGCLLSIGCRTDDWQTWQTNSRFYGLRTELKLKIG